MTWELRHGDCLDPVTGLASLPDKSVAHTIMDPPYEAEAHTTQRRVKRSGGIMEIEPLSFAPITPEARAAVAGEVGRVTSRWAIVFCQIEASGEWARVLIDAGMSYRRTCVWVKPDGMPQYSGDRPGMGYEAIVVAHAAGRSRWNGGGRTGVFTHCKNDRVRTGHPTQKPISLMREIVELFTDPGELVLDPFAGSGTTLVACESLGRNSIGWERDPGFYETARRRLSGEETKPAPGQLAMFGVRP